MHVSIGTLLCGPGVCICPSSDDESVASGAENSSSLNSPPVPFSSTVHLYFQVFPEFSGGMLRGKHGHCPVLDPLAPAGRQSHSSMGNLLSSHDPHLHRTGFARHFSPRSCLLPNLWHAHTTHHGHPINGIPL